MKKLYYYVILHQEGAYDNEVFLNFKLLGKSNCVKYAFYVV